MKKSLSLLTLVFLAISIALPAQQKLFAYIPGHTGGAAISWETREAMSRRILSSTVRIHLRTWQNNEDGTGHIMHESIGHATLRDGRLLVTHNHYRILEDVGRSQKTVCVVIYDADGRRILTAPLNAFSIIGGGQESMILKMEYDYMAQQLAEAGVRSAVFDDGQGLDLQPGMAVAQVDWDGRRTRVDWTQIEDVITGHGVPRLVLKDGVYAGGSGGGVFWNGLHIANNWRSVRGYDAHGRLVDEISVASMN